MKPLCPLGTTAKAPKLLLPPTTEPPSSPTLPILPVDLIVQIFLRLPVWSLLQLKCVCKLWKTLISSPKFAKDHLQRSLADPTLTHPRLAYASHLCRFGIFSIQSLFENPSVPTKVVCFGKRTYDDEILGSCNGLLCLYDNWFDSITLWNPCTGLTSQSFELKGPINEPSTYREYVRQRGFGYDHIHDKYKLFVVLSGDLTETRICTFGGENSWKTIADFPFHTDNLMGIFVSGTLNWIARVPGTTNQWMILFFVLGNETYHQMSLPHNKYDDHRCNPKLEVLRNCLSVCYLEGTQWVLWLMNKHGVEQSWTKLILISHVELMPDGEDGESEHHPLKPLYISENDVVLAKFHYSRLILYNSHDGQVNYPMIDSSNGTRRCYDWALSEYTHSRKFHIYYDSLVSPSHCGLQDVRSLNRLHGC